MLKAFIFITIFHLLFPSVTAAGQNLSGTWEGYTSSGADYWRMGIVQVGDSCYCFSYDEGPGFCKQNFSAYYNSREKRFSGEGIDFITRSADHALISATLRYQKKENSEYLSGTVYAKSLVSKILSLGMGSFGQLRKISDEIDSTAYIKSAIRRLLHTNTVSATETNIIREESNVPANVKKKNDSIIAAKAFSDSLIRLKNSRNAIVAKMISTKADSVKIILYDDGEIDGDIVTIFDNDKILVNKLTLTKTPYQLTLALTAGNSKHIIELMAENEGSIPPNTAYMLVLAGSDRVEVKTSADKLSNAAVVIQKATE